MSSPSSVAKHPIHPMLVTFPIGLWVFSLISDIIFRSGGGQVWWYVAYYNIIAGVVGALLAAIPGFIDLFSLKPSRAKRVGLWHMGLNLAIVVLFIVNYYIRGRSVQMASEPFILSIIGIALLLVSGWLGGEMVYVHGIAVDREAAPDRQPEPMRTQVKVR